MANVIREDVVSVEFDIDDGGIRDSLKMLENFKEEIFKGFQGLSKPVDDLKKSLISGIDTSGITDMKSSSEQAKETIEDLESGVKSVKEEFSTGIDTSGIDGVKKSSEQATESVKKFSGITESIERFDERITALKDNIKSFGSTIAHPLSTVKNGFSSIKNEISETASKIKNLAQTKMSNLTSNIKEMYSTLSRGQTGAKGFVTALKSIGKVGFEKTISGFQSIKKSIKSITFDKIKSGLSSIKSGTSSVLSGFKSLGSSAQKVASNIKTAFSNVGSKIKSVASNISSAADSITSKLFNIKSLVAGVATGAVVQQSVGIVVDRQNITSQFEVLLGSAEKANERVSELTDFAGMTPFTRDEIFAASKQLQVFTGDALSTGDSLRIIGDVAAGTGQQFEDVALWTGRLYDAMKSGRTVGEMTSRLQEMGAISGEDRTKIEKLAESGEDITQTWTEVEKIFSRYDGTMEKLSNNLGNMLTSLKSFATNSIFLPLGEGIASGLQPAIQKFRDFRKSNKEDVTAMGEVINNFAEKICVPLFNKIEQGAEFAIKAIASLKDGMSGLNKLKGTSPLLDKLIEAINFVVSHKETFIGAAKGIAAAMGGIVAAGKFTKIISALSGLLNPLTLVTAAFGILFNALKNDSVNGGTALTDLKNIAVTVFDSIKNAISTFSEILSNNKGLFSDIINTIVGLLPPLAEAFGEVLTAMIELATAALPVLLDVFRELFEAVKPLLKQLPDLIKFIAKIIKACAKADVIEALAKGFIAYKVAVVAVTAVMKVYNTIQAILYVKSVLAAKGITLMQAAFKLLKLALVSHPIFAIAAVIGAVGTAIALFSKKADKGNEANAQLKQHIDEVTGSIHSMRDAFDNAKVTLPDYDKLISYKGNTLGDIDEQISQKEALITEAIKNAIKDQKNARDDDIQNIKQYMQDIQGLEEEKLSIYASQQTAQINNMANELRYGNPDQQRVADITASAKETFEKSNQAISDAYTARLTNIENWYTAERTSIENNEKITGKARADALKKVTDEYNKQNKEAFDWNNTQLDTAQSKYNEVYDLALTKSTQLMTKSGIDFDTIKTKLDGYDSYLDNVNNKTSETYSTVAFNTDQFTGEINTFLLGMDDNMKQYLHNMLLTANEAKNNGVALSNETQEHLDTILRMFETLPPETQETGKEILAGLIQGMTDENGNAVDTTDMSCQQIIEAARNALDVHSPSRVFAEIGTNIGLGLLQGISLIMPVVTAAVTTNMMGLVTSASGFNLDSMGESAENISETVILAFSNMNKVSCQHISGMQKSVVLISKLMSTTVIVNLKTMSVQAVIIVQSMSVSIVSTMSQMKSSIDGLDLYSTGVNVMNGLINGMESRRGGLISTAQSIAQTVKNTMNNALDIHSPSRELYKTGVYTGLGQINGMKSTLPEIQQTADKMGQTAIPDDNNRYAPSASPANYSRSTTSENHTYSPTFNLTISGTNDDRTMARKVKKWISEALEETFSSYESKNATVREV
ncbi:MAG: hypothetical protein ACLUV3_00720 [Oscillospiraceae bacterium]